MILTTEPSLRSPITRFKLDPMAYYKVSSYEMRSQYFITFAYLDTYACLCGCNSNGVHVGNQGTSLSSQVYRVCSGDQTQAVKVGPFRNDSLA